MTGPFMAEYQHILSFLMVIWFIGLFFCLIRSGVELKGKIAALIVFAFYVWFEWNSLNQTLTALQTDYKTLLLSELIRLSKILFYLLPMVWVVSLIIIFFMIDESKAEKIIISLFFITLVFWSVWMIDYFWGDQLGPFLMQEIPKFFP